MSEVVLTEDFIDVSLGLKKLHDAVGLLKEARIKHECDLSYCFELMRRGASGDEVAVRALEYAVAHAARQVRLSIMNKPRWKKMMEDIQYGRKRTGAMKVVTYHALYPFAMREFE